MPRPHPLLAGVAFLWIAACGAQDDIDVKSAVLDRRYVLTTCITSSMAASGTRSAPPCVTSATTSMQTQIDSARLRVDQFHASEFTVGTSTRSVGCATCAPSAQQVTSSLGGYDVKPDSVIVATSTPGFNGMSRFPFFGDVPAVVKQSWFGPDSLIMEIAPGRFAVFRNY